jgi:hypothetical protein
MLSPGTGVILCAAIAALWPAPMAAQAAIAGEVRDATGAPLGGVRVGVSSTDAIQQPRTAVTSDSGQYVVSDLRPGTFTLTFAHAGFTTATRDDIELTGSFVATVNVTLAVGAVAETVDVPTPAVDVRSTRQQAVMTAATIAAVPTGRSLANLGGLVPGMTTLSARAQADVGGTNNLQNQFLAIHGGRYTDQRTYVDGVTIRNLQSEGYATNFTPDVNSTAEVVIDTSAAGAEEAQAGVRTNYIPREGGNRLTMSVFAGGTSGRFQEDNLTADVKARGLLLADSLKHAYDINPTVGGPLVRGRAWFYAAARVQSNEAYLGGVYANRNAGNAAAWAYAPDVSQPGLFAIDQRSANARVTWRPAVGQKAGIYAERQWRRWDEGNVMRAPEAFSRFRFAANQIVVGSWSDVVSPRLLLEARGAYHAEAWTNIGGDGLLPNNRSLVPVLEQGGAFPGLMYRAKNGVYTGNAAPFIASGVTSVSYAAGAHALTAGGSVLGGTNTNPNTFDDSGLQYRFNNGVPNQITEFATPYTLAWHVTEIGGYVQDRWTRSRLTVSGGVRLDYFGSSFPQQHLGPATLLPARDATVPATPFYALTDLSPRLGAAFDLTGRGRTVVKATAGRYVVAVNPSVGNPISNLPLSVTRAWTDGNGDYVPDCDLMNPGRNGECGAMSDAAFGGLTPSVRYDPAIVRGWNVRPYDWEFSAALQHELRPRVAASVAYIRRVYGNFTVQDNLATTAADYTAFAVTAPLDGRLPGGGGYVVGGLYDLNPDKRGAVNTYVTAADRYGRQIEHWDGVDATVKMTRTRMMLMGGASTGRSLTDICAVVAAVPEMLGSPSAVIGGRAVPFSLDQCHMDGAWLTQVKALASYAVPRLDVQLAATVQSSPGADVQANYVAANAVVQPSLGRPLSGAANTTVSLLPPGRVFADRVNQLDLRVAKTLRRARSRTALNVDLYNALNANPVTAMNLSYVDNGAGWLRPQAILPARVFRISVEFTY